MHIKVVLQLISKIKIKEDWWDTLEFAFAQENG
jgi:hypothetical protein